MVCWGLLYFQANYGAAAGLACVTVSLEGSEELLELLAEQELEVSLPVTAASVIKALMAAQYLGPVWAGFLEVRAGKV